MTHPDTTFAVLLAGGLSSRMAGADKAFADLAGKPLIAHVADRIAPQVAGLIVSANGDAQRYGPYASAIVPDLPGTERHGPLAGILAAVTWMLAHRPDVQTLLTVSCDAPFLPLDLVARLAAARPRDSIALATSDGRRHPTIALWPAALAPAIAASLAAGDRALDGFARRHGAVEVPFAFGEGGIPGADPFFNVNTPDDLHHARTYLERRGIKYNDLGERL